MPGAGSIPSIDSGFFPSGFTADFASFLQSQSRLTDLAVSRARRASTQTGSRLDRVVVELGLLSEWDAAKALSDFLNLPTVTFAEFPAKAVRPDLIRYSFVLGASVMPISIDAGRLVVAAVDPFNEEPVRALAYLTDLKVDMRVVAAADFNKAIKALYEEDGGGASSEVLQDLVQEGDALDVQRLRDNASEAPVLKLVNQIINAAIEVGASDIHLEPLDGVLQVRVRVDGVLRPVQPVPGNLRAAVVSRIKIMAKLDIAERRRPQDGRLRVTGRGNEVDFRISTIPTAKGESVVMRLLDRSRVSLDFESLGFEGFEIAAIRRLIAQPNGIVLITGPTGSGKTTTLYAALKELNRDRIKIFTVEDPVEYQLEGINQVQVQPTIGLDFPQALRSILRQDPDIIMIGEIRDVETARIAVQAALTGHLVLTTLHTNSAASAITRLVDMGIEAFLLGSTIRGVLAQRLVRRCCAVCADDTSSSPHPISSPQERDVCETCHGSRFSGRMTIAEILLLDAGLQHLVNARSSDADLEAAARSKGMRTIHEAGLAMVGKGLTTLEEVLRVTQAI